MIGLKIDARDDDRVLQELANKGEQPATPQDGRKIAKILNAEYMECSSFSRKGVKEVFEAVQKIVIESKNKQSEAEGKPKKKCLVMWHQFLSGQQTLGNLLLLLRKRGFSFVKKWRIDAV